MEYFAISSCTIIFMVVYIDSSLFKTILLLQDKQGVREMFASILSCTIMHIGNKQLSNRPLIWWWQWWLTQQWYYMHNELSFKHQCQWWVFFYLGFTTWIKPIFILSWSHIGKQTKCKLFSDQDDDFDDNNHSGIFSTDDFSILDMKTNNSNSNCACLNIFIP